MPSAAAGAGHHQMPGGINLKPTFIPQLTQHAGHRHPCGAEGAGDLLMGQAKVEPQHGLTGVAKASGEQFQDALDPFFTAAPGATPPGGSGRPWR